MSVMLQAVVIANEVFGDQHPKYADTLIDYGFYLLSVDAISQGVQVYQASFWKVQGGGRSRRERIYHFFFCYSGYIVSI